MSMTETMLLAVGLPTLLLLIGLLAMAITNTAAGEKASATDGVTPSRAATRVLKKEPAPKEETDTDLTRKLTVWTGGASLALAGYFLIQYAIEHSMLTPLVRVGIGSLFGLSLIIVAEILRARKKGVDDGSHTAPSLAGAGVACLYATLYGAGNLYGILQPMQAFAAMALVTLGAGMLSLRHGMPVAIIGMMGGYLMPFIVKAPLTEAAPMFGYLFLLTAGLFAVARQRGWEGFGVAALTFAYGWAFYWQVSSHFEPADAKWIGLYILALAGTAAIQPEGPGVRNALHYFSAATAFPLMALTVSLGGYQTISWQLSAILVLASFFAAHRAEQYNWMPWMGAFLAGVLLASWPAASAPPSLYAAVVFSCLALFGGGSGWLLGTRPAVLWAALLPVSAFVFFGIAYLRLENHMHVILGLGKGAWVWSGIAALIALGFAVVTAWLKSRPSGDAELHDRILSVTASTAAAFAVCALVIDTPEKYVTIGLAIEILIACWISTKIDLKALRVVAIVLAGGFIFAFLRQVYAVIALKVNGSSELLPLSWGGQVPMVANPLLVLGVPMILLLVSAGVALQRRDGRLVKTLEGIFCALAVPLIYYSLRGMFVPPKDILYVSSTFLQCGIATNLFYAVALVIICAGRKYGRDALVWGGMAIFYFAIFRTTCLDLIAKNPVLSGQGVDGPALFNPLLVAYALPVLWLTLAGRPLLRIDGMNAMVRGFLSLTLLVVWSTLAVRHYFHHPVLTGGVTTNAEIYAYSACWLLLGTFLLVIGILRDDKPLRQASFGVIALTVAKVFLYDVSALDDLYRVFAFLGLGLSLFVLNWIYGKFVAKKIRREA